MKLTIPTTLFMCSALCPVQTDVSVEIASCRTVYRTHDATDNPGFSVKLKLTPAAGIHVTENETLPLDVHLIDSQRNKQKSHSGRLVRSEHDGHLYAAYTFKKRPTGAEVKIEGNIAITIAKDVQQETPQAINLISASEFSLRNAPFKVIPAASNANKSNREGNRLKRAEITLSYPQNINLMSIARQWSSDLPSDSQQNAHFSQEVLYTTVTDEQGNKLTQFVLVDVLESPIIQFTTCSETNSTTLPVSFIITLSEASQIQSPTGSTSAAPSK